MGCLQSKEDEIPKLNVEVKNNRCPCFSTCCEDACDNERIFCCVVIKTTEDIAKT